MLLVTSIDSAKLNNRMKLKTMTVSFKPYDHAAEYDRVGQFLNETWKIAEGHINWMQPRWEYMHFHPLIKQVRLDSIGIWTEGEEIVAVVHPEHEMGVAYFELRPEYAHLKQDMLAHAEDHISSENKGVRQLGVYVNDTDIELQTLVDDRGYAITGRSDPISQIVADRVPTKSPLPHGFKLQSLAEDNDLPKLNRCLWRGFDHGVEPPDDGVKGSRLMQSAPNYKKDLNLVVVAPDGNFVSYCGMWYEPAQRVAYVEPVATDPDYRRMGLGTAVVLEGVRRCIALGATAAYVGSAMPFYRSMGFEPVYTSTLWVRERS